LTIDHFSLPANAEQIDAAKEVLKKLQFTYTAESFENPVLQRYWRNIEALALDREAPEEMTDYTCELLYPGFMVIIIYIHNLQRQLHCLAK